MKINNNGNQYNTIMKPRPLPTTQAEIASLAGCCRQTVAKWARGCQVLPAIEASIWRAVKELKLKQNQNQ